MYFGLPRNPDEKIRFDDLRNHSDAFLLVLDGPPERTASVQALESLGLSTGSSYSLQQGEFFPRFLDDTVERVPGIGRMKLLFENGPPIGRLTVAPEPPPNRFDGFQTFNSSNELVEWVDKTWEDRHRSRKKTVFSWNHPFVLVLIVTLMTVGWWLRDRAVGEVPS